MKTITGYADKISVAPSETIRFKVSCEGQNPEYSARLVRLISTEDHPEGPGLVEREVPAPFVGTYKGRHQAIRTGSYGIVRHPTLFRALESFTLQCLVWPTLPGRGRQTLLSGWSDRSQAGFSLDIDEGGSLSCTVGNGLGDVHTVRSDVALAEREWVLAGASFDAGQSRLQLLHRSLPNGADKPITRLRGEVLPKNSFVVDSAEIFIAASLAESDAVGTSEMRFHFNGKIEAPVLLNCALGVKKLKDFLPAALSKSRLGNLVAAWDFSLEQSSDQIKDRSANQLHGRLINMPTRAVKGQGWSGHCHDWRVCPDEYGAIHFHEDDLYDAGWKDDFSFTVPEDLESGVYAARLEASEASPSYITFFIRPPKGEARSDIVYLASTATYMAYANQHVLGRDRYYETGMGALPIITDEDIFLQAHPECGKSLYDHHTDGSGVCYSSRLRPILNMAPNSRHWTFSGDGYLTAWLDAMGMQVDVITDEDLHREGAELLRSYRVVLTGCHPEYVSLSMWGALETHLSRGGRLMYLGGNGFYWRIAFHPSSEGVIEVRRAEDGSRTWAAEPGEYYMSLSGEYGGMWRRQDRTPNRLLGVGFCAQGFQSGSYYVRREGSDDPRVDFVFAGTSGDIKFGGYGIAGGGAAGQELDRYDVALGSPRHALVLASSEGHTDEMIIAKEELGALHHMIGGTQNPDVRSDMVFFETPSGGAVFSVGSISWCTSLPINGYDNDVSRITRNVLTRFVDPTPFACP